MLHHTPGHDRYIKHYFKFRNKEGDDEEFITVYRRAGSQLEYLRTMSRRAVWGPEFQTLSESGPWSMTITYLIEQGQRLSANTRPTRGHFASKIGPTGPEPTTPKPRTSGIESAKRSEVGLSIDFNGWQVRNNVGGDQLIAGAELSQDYEFSNREAMLSWSTSGPANLQINCRIEKGLRDLAVNATLFLYFRPFRLTGETPLVMRLYTADQTEGGQVPVIARPFNGFRDKGSDWVALAVMGNREATQRCISALRSGQQLYFTLFKEQQLSEKFYEAVSYFIFDQSVKLPLPPDPTFKEVYDESYQRIVNADAGDTDAGDTDDEVIRNFALGSKFSDEVRKNPKDYAVWMHEPNPGEFAVLLVKLDHDGSMADAWSLGSFQSKTKQGTFALDVARDFQIKLMDVVPTSPQEPNTPTSVSVTYSVAKMDNQKLPPSSGTIWLDGDEIWFTQPTKDFSLDGHSYHIPAGATCFPREKIGREVLLNVLRKQRDLWAPGDEAAVKARIKEHARKWRVD